MDEEGGAAAMTELLPLVPDVLSAVYAINDTMAIGALGVLGQAGFRVPDDVSLIGCDDIPVAAQLQPALTTVWQPKRELGYLAAKLILRQIKTRQERGDDWQEKYPFQSAMYLPRVVERDSTRPYQAQCAGLSWRGGDERDRNPIDHHRQPLPRLAALALPTARAR